MARSVPPAGAIGAVPWPSSARLARSVPPAGPNRAGSLALVAEEPGERVEEPIPGAREPADGLDALEVYYSEHVELYPGLWHLELFGRSGLLTVLWHGPLDSRTAVVTCGGAVGSLLGPARALFYRLGEAWADMGIATLRVGYRRPGDLDRCTTDAVAAVDLALLQGAERVVTIGHSFGGAVAVRAAAARRASAAGVVTLSTQAGGAEPAEELDGCPMLLVHGGSDQVLSPAASGLVRMLAPHAELLILPTAGHGLQEAADEVFDRLYAWVPVALTGVSDR
jgi:pimeloyl-ACP methyl ester carboxylesterase